MTRSPEPHKTVLSSYSNRGCIIQVTHFSNMQANSPNFAGMMSGSFSSPTPSLPPESPRSLLVGAERSKEALLGPGCFSACGWQPSWSLPERDRRNFTTTRRTTDRSVRAAPTIMPRMGDIGSSPSDAAKGKLSFSRFTLKTQPEPRQYL